VADNKIVRLSAAISSPRETTQFWSFRNSHRFADSFLPPSRNPARFNVVNAPS
jgi:hypothetical protein